MATSKATSTTKKPAAKKPAAPKPVVQSAPAVEAENVVPAQKAATVAPVSEQPKKKLSFAQAMKQSPKVKMVIPIDPAFEDEFQLMEFGYLGEAFILQRGVEITVNELVKAEIERRLKYQKESKERALAERKKIAKQLGLENN